MQLFNRNSHDDAGTNKTNVTLRITAVAGVLVAAPVIFCALAPTSIAILQVILDVCQFCISVLRICGM